MTSREAASIRVYIAGPMTYIPQFNFPAFDALAAELREHGYTVVSPAELDSPEDRERAMASPNGEPIHYTYGKTHADFLARDLKIIADSVDAICVLPGWARSSGARIETFIGFVYNKPIVQHTGYGTLSHVPKLQLFRAWCGEITLRIGHRFGQPAEVVA